MKTVAIITEYNPFHYGHLYQLEQIKEAFGEDTRIISIMSGNFTQRGEIAIANKSTRAEAAVDSGVDLVLELPFPYSSSSAELFAFGGVSIANALGIVDYLAFGSECADIETLKKHADILSSGEFSSELKRLNECADYKELGYPALCELAYKNVAGSCPADLLSPNNILGVEYIKALRKAESKIEPITFKRAYSDYNDKELIGGRIQSATAIRSTIYSSIDQALEYLPEPSRAVYRRAIEKGDMPTIPEELDKIIISHLRLNSPEKMENIHDVDGGLYNRLHKLSFEANSISALMQLAETKKYTKARIRRAIWNSYFGVTSSVIHSAPSYTQVLGMNDTGRKMLKEIKTKSGFAVITKPSSYTELDGEVIRQKELSDRADSIFALAHKKAISGRFSLRLTPYVKKG